MSGTSVVATVIVDRGRVVLVRRARPEGTLVWTFPSGKLEPGESAAAAAERESREETGLTVRADTVLGERVHPKTGHHLVYVACTPLTGTVHVASPDEVVDVAWVEPAELSTYGVRDLHPAVQEHLDTAAAQALASVRQRRHPFDEQRLARLYESGLSARQCGEAFGRSAKLAGSAASAQLEYGRGH